MDGSGFEGWDIKINRKLNLVFKEWIEERTVSSKKNGGLLLYRLQILVHEVISYVAK